MSTLNVNYTQSDSTTIEIVVSLHKLKNRHFQSQQVKDWHWSLATLAPIEGLCGRGNVALPR